MMTSTCFFPSKRYGSLLQGTLLFAMLAAPRLSLSAAEGTLPLTALDLKLMSQDYGKPKVDKSFGGNPLTIGGKTYERGLGSHAESRLLVAVNGAKRFTAVVGLDDEVDEPGNARFRIIGDGKTLFDSGMMKSDDAGKAVDVRLDGVKQLLLVTSVGSRGIDYCHVNWAQAQFVVDGPVPVAVTLPVEQAEILTPPVARTPRVNGAKAFGVRRGSPILYTVAATGDRPMSFKATPLPEGVTFDEQSGRFGGSVAKPGTYPIRITAANTLGTAQVDFKLVVGDQLALTPPMGWNSWYGYADRVTDGDIRRSADAIVSLGLADHGWSYVMIDDFWQQTPHKMAKEPTLGGPGRAASGHIVPNPRFPDMKALADYIHGRGLKAGLYSSPGPLTCGGALGSYGHEAADAQRYAEWGFDLLKYDWCSYRPASEDKRTTPVDWSKNPLWGRPEQSGHEKEVRPYAMMGDLLRQQPRDIYYLMCQYGMADSWTWARGVGGQSARTTGDITDTWGSVSGIGFGQYGRQGNSGPGYWSDPDMLMVGVIGLSNPHPSRLTPNEQYAQVSLWAILPAPLLFGAHLDKLDDFTKNLLTNDEVIEINQDTLGQQGKRVERNDETEVWAKPLADGSYAVALFNRGEMPTTVTATWNTIGVSGPQIVRDVWRQKDLGQVTDAYTATVPRHGVAVVRIRKP